MVFLDWGFFKQLYFVQLKSILGYAFRLNNIDLGSGHSGFLMPTLELK